ncbi:MAG: hypothetical protein ACUVWJ_07945 [Spirochaetota bacterium]
MKSGRCYASFVPYGWRRRKGLWQSMATSLERPFFLLEYSALSITRESTLWVFSRVRTTGRCFGLRERTASLFMNLSRKAIVFA